MQYPDHNTYIHTSYIKSYTYMGKVKSSLTFLKKSFLCKFVHNSIRNQRFGKSPKRRKFSMFRRLGCLCPLALTFPYISPIPLGSRLSEFFAVFSGFISSWLCDLQLLLLPVSLVFLSICSSVSFLLHGWNTQCNLQNFSSTALPALCACGHEFESPMELLLFLRVREAICPRLRPHSGYIEL